MQARHSKYKSSKEILARMMNIKLTKLLISLRGKIFHINIDISTTTTNIVLFSEMKDAGYFYLNGVKINHETMTFLE
jgi:hypothetical protein